MTQPAAAIIHSAAQWARWYAKRKLQVLALRPGDKVPATEHGCKDATVDPATINAMWAAEPARNVGIATGRRSKIVVLDIDGQEGEASLVELTRLYGAMPITAEVRTGKGRHLYLSNPGQPIRNSAGKLGPGLDVRADGGYVVAPPSIHPNGSRYEWAPGRRPDQTEFAELPAWLREQLVEREQPRVQRVSAPSLDYVSDAYARVALERECGSVANAANGGRNHQLNESSFSIGQLVAGGCLEENRARTALLTAAEGCGLPLREAQLTINSGLTAGMKQPRTAPERPQTNSHVPSRGAHVSAAPATESEAEWPDPIPLPGLPPVPAWNDALLPDALRPWVSDIAERTQCPSEYVAVGAIAALGSVIGRSCAIRPKQHDDWTVVPNLWAAVVGPPSAMKSPALREAMRPLLTLAQDASREYEARRFERDAIEAERKTLGKALEKAAEKSGDLTELRARHVALEVRAASISVERRYVVYDTTVEKLGEILRASPRGVLMFRDELTGFLGSLDRAGHESDRAFYLEAWNGDGEFIYDRIQRGTVRIDAACVSILGGIQPGPLGRYLLDAVAGGAGADGLMQRFQLLVFPDARPTWKNVDRQPNIAAQDRALAVFQQLASTSADSAGGIPFVRFDEQAQLFFDEWRSELEKRLRAGEEHEATEAHLAKYRSLLPSLALIFELADRGCAGPVRLMSAERAAAWCDFLEEHARRVYASVATTSLNGARLLLAKIRSGRLPAPFVARDVYRSAWTGLSDPDAVKAAIAALEQHAWVRVVETPTGGKPRLDVHAHPTLVVRRCEP